MFELTNIAIILPVVFMAMFYQSNGHSAQLRMCVYVILSTLALLVNDEDGAENFIVIAMIVLLVALVVILKLNRKRDVADD